MVNSDTPISIVYYVVLLSFKHVSVKLFILILLTVGLSRCLLINVCMVFSTLAVN